MTEPVCKTCTHYRQHYEVRTLPAPLPNREQVIQFLATEFLQYILSLDLPPEQMWQITCFSSHKAKRSHHKSGGIVSCFSVSYSTNSYTST